MDKTNRCTLKVGDAVDFDEIVFRCFSHTNQAIYDCIQADDAGAKP